MPFRTLREFIQLETAAGLILFLTAICALIIDNTAWSVYYESFFNTPLTLRLGVIDVTKSILLWINDGLMTIFFCLVGLEIKREIVEGELNSFAKASLPVIAAIGGMLFPAIIYVLFNYKSPHTLDGWAIPTATDIAFSLGILSLLRSRIPLPLKIFLTALAIFDDIGAIAIIAVFYTKHISVSLLLVSAGLVLLLFILNRLRVMSIIPYVIVGIFLWLCVLKSGVHATLSGIALAFVIPIRDRSKMDVSPLRRLEHRLHPWVAFGILPIFAFANAGVSFAGIHFDALLSPVTLGIALGLFLGKQLGISLVTWLSIKLRLARMPHGGTVWGMYGISLVAGVGFTMSLFIGTLAFRGGGNYPALVRFGVIVGSSLSGMLGYLVLRLSYKPHEHHSLMR